MFRRLLGLRQIEFKGNHLPYTFLQASHLGKQRTIFFDRLSVKMKIYQKSHSFLFVSALKLTNCWLMKTL